MYEDVAKHTSLVIMALLQNMDKNKNQNTYVHTY